MLEIIDDRRIRRSLMLLSVLASLLACREREAPADPGLAGDAVMFRGGPTHSASGGGPAPLTYGGLQWRFQTAGPVVSSPAVTNGTVFVGSGDGFLYAIDALTGDERWRFRADGPVDSSPAVVGNVVLFVSRKGTLHALEADSGTGLWSVKTRKPVPLPWGYESGDYFTSSVVLDGTRAVFGSRDGHVYAVDTQDGAIVWTHAFDAQIWATPAIADGVVFVGGQDGTLYALSATDGALRWRFETEGHRLDTRDYVEHYGYDRRTIQSSPTVHDGAVFFGSRDGHLYAVEASSGDLRWRYHHDENSWSISSPVVAGRFVLGGSSDAHCDVHALNWRTGDPLWHLRLGSAILSSPSIAGSTIYIGSSDGAVYALRGSGTGGLRRAVYWDATMVVGATVADHERVRNYFAAHGYEILDAAELTRFLEDRVDDAKASVIVFALDRLPTELVVPPLDTSLVRRYLDAGGKMVWLGWPPLVWLPDSLGVRSSYAEIDRAQTERLLGVNHEGSNFDRFGAEPTPVGKQWGLLDWWVGNWSVNAEAPSKVLAKDSNGRAVAWVQEFGGASGTGFVRLAGFGTSDERLAQVRAVAEYRPN
ncbi:MAG: PQQ-binding-like beta-propeller repeat protein [Gemmatimonadota bacterium]